MERLSYWYRKLHQIPEVALKEDKTRKFIKEELDKMALSYTSLTGYDILVYFDFHQKETIGFRSEMDGLKIEEETGLDYQSLHPGYMHACGHDGHMAILLGLAHELTYLEKCNYNVLLIFQMAEESIGGAKLLCEKGLKEKYRMTKIFALHNMPQLEPNCIYSNEGPFFASSCEIDGEIVGRSAHISERHQGKDSLKAMFHLYQSLESLMNHETICFHIGQLTGGTIRNAVAQKTTFSATLRGFSNQDVEKALSFIQEKCKEVEINDQVGIHLTIRHLYPILINTKQNIDYQRIDRRFLCDDFSVYLQEIEGQYFLIGNRYNAPLHSSLYRFDENNLEAGVRFYLSILNCL